MAMQPLSGDDIWWQVSRGREVLAGSVTPSQDLLVNEEQPETDWLGGVPYYLAWRVSPMSGLMLFKFAALGLLAVALWKSAAAHNPWLAVAGVVCGVYGFAHATYPASALLDGLSLAAVVWLCRRLCERPGLLRAGGVVSVTVLWANFAPSFVLAPFVAGATMASFTDTTRPSARSAIGLVFGCCMACVATPRGIWSAWDSLRLLIPQLATDLPLQGTGWQPLLAGPFDATSCTFLIVSLLAVAVFVVRPPGFAALLGLAVAQALGWLSVANLPVASLWIALLALGQIRGAPLLVFAGTAKRSLGNVTARFAGIIGGSVLAVAIAGGWLPGTRTRLGWGIDPSLDPARLAGAIPQGKLTGTAHGDGLAAVGMLSHVLPDGPRPLDVPHRALLGNRFEDWRVLNHELENEWQMPYRRDDGRWGGWWLPLRNRDVRLLVVSADNRRLIRGLQPGIWKPLSLDSPVIPYGYSADPVYAAKIAHVNLVLRQQLQNANWNYIPLSRWGSETHWDFWGTVTGRGDPVNDLRLARSLRAMNMHHAAIRVLQATSHPAADAEIAACRAAIAYQDNPVGQ